MKPIMQRICEKGRGDCLSACVASLIELSIEQVPNFNDCEKFLNGRVNWFGDKENGFWYFLQKNGFEYKASLWDKKEIKNELENGHGVDGFFIASVKSVNFENTKHSVIFERTELAHDPSTKNKWQGTIDDILDLMVIEKQ